MTQANLIDPNALPLTGQFIRLDFKKYMCGEPGCTNQKIHASPSALSQNHTVKVHQKKIPNQKKGRKSMSEMDSLRNNAVAEVRNNMAESDDGIGQAQFLEAFGSEDSVNSGSEANQHMPQSSSKQRKRKEREAEKPQSIKSIKTVVHPNVAQTNGICD
jgi:hypothetical protein